MKHLKILLCIIAAFTLTVSAFSADASASWYDDISGGTYSVIVGEPYVADTFYGVKALYSLVPGSYQCAELIPRFYKEAYGLDTFIFAGYGSAFGMEPIEMQTSGYKFVTPETPSAGDVIYTTSTMRNGNGDHWAIVKSFDGSTITLFEQNVKYNGKAGINRKLKYPSEYYYIYSPRKISDNSKPSLGGSNAPETTVAPSTTAVQTTAAPTTTAVITTTEKPTVITTAATTAVYTTSIPSTVARTTMKSTTRAVTTVVAETEEATTGQDEMLAEAVSEESTTAPEQFSAQVAMLYNEATDSPESTEAEETLSSINFKPVIAGGTALVALIVFFSVLLITKKSRG